MKVLRAYKTELNPNDRQRTMFFRCAGAARFVFNWALADRKQRYEEQELSTNKFEQKRRFNEWKRRNAPWIYDVPYTLQEQEFDNVDKAFQAFFRRIKKGETPGHPRFKKRNGRKRFTLRKCIHIESDRIKLPRIGWVRLKESGYLPLDGTVKLLSVNISERAGRWFISAQVEETISDPSNDSTITIGADLGLKALVVLSNGKVFENSKPLHTAQRKLARLQRELSRRERGGANWHKTKAKLQKQHAKIANIRKHILHDVSHHVTAVLKPKTVVLENLNVSGMMKNHRLARAISDVGFAELRRQIEYKAIWHGIEVIVADRWFPSSKVCSGCGCIRDKLTLSERTYTCEHCGLVIDRDLNAAKNLAALGEGRNTAGLPVELECRKALLRSRKLAAALAA